MSFLFFSTESLAPTGKAIMDLLHPVELAFNERYSAERYSDALDSIAIIPMCMTADMRRDWKERRYVSKKNRYADVRLWIDYDTFRAASAEERSALCRRNIQDAVAYIKSRSPSLRDELLIRDIFSLLDSAKGEA